MVTTTSSEIRTTTITLLSVLMVMFVNHGQPRSHGSWRKRELIQMEITMLSEKKWLVPVFLPAWRQFPPTIQDTSIQMTLNGTSLMIPASQVHLIINYFALKTRLMANSWELRKFQAKSSGLLVAMLATSAGSLSKIENYDILWYLKRYI